MNAIDPKAIVRHFLNLHEPTYTPLLPYAALPLILTPELLHYLRHTFTPKTPWIAEADILLDENLCQQYDTYEQYLMHAPIRAHLLAEARQGPAFRLADASRLLLGYLQNLERTRPYRNPRELLTQAWSAMVYIDDAHRGKVFEEIKDAFRQASQRQSGKYADLIGEAELLRLAQIIEKLAPEIAQHPEILDYARQVRAIIRNDPNLDEWVFRPILGKDMPSAAELTGKQKTKMLGHPTPRPKEPIRTKAAHIYVSYSWSAENKTPIMALLEKACNAYGLGVVRDAERLKYGDSIRVFMDEISNSGNIILVFSRNYFVSEYCMYELLQVWKNGSFHARIYPISLGDIRLDDIDVQISLIDHWERRTKELKEKLKGRDSANTMPLQERNIGYADIYRHINELMAFVSNMNILPLDDLRRQNFLPLLNRIRPAKTQESIAKPRWYRKSDAEFQRTIREAIKEVLGWHDNLREALYAKTREVLGHGDPLEILCKAEPISAINDVLRPATEQCLSELLANSDEYIKTWEAAKSVLGWLSLFSVKPEWIDEQEKRSGPGGGMLEIAAKTPCGVEIASSRFRQIPPNFHAESGKTDVRGNDEIRINLELGWDDSYALSRLLLEIWSRVFPHEHRHSLSDGHIAKLNSTLRLREKNKINHYYIIIRESDASPLNREDFYEKFLAKLPAITIVNLKTSGEGSTLQVDGYDLMVGIRELLTIPYNKRHLSQTTSNFSVLSEP